MNSTLISTLYYPYHHRLPSPWEQVMRMEGEGNYTIFVLMDGTRQLSSKSLCVYEPHLPVDFVRVHKSCVINRCFVVRFDKAKRCVLMTDGGEVKVSRRRQEFVKSTFN